MTNPVTYERKYFFDCVRASLFRGNLTQSQVDGMTHILDLWEKNFPYKSKSHLAYIFATIYHETDQKMRPVEEYGKGKGQKYGVPTGPYNKVYYGRGHVQLTWEDNYKKGTGKIKPYGFTADLHQYPEKALEDDISAVIMFDGMGDGWFTGVGLSKYFNDTTEDPVNARRTVNGTDKADLIASYYWKFQEALEPISEVDPGPPEGPQMPEPEPPVTNIVPTVTVTLSSDAPVIVKLSYGDNITIDNS